MARPFLSVIIPAYNEAERLPLTLLAIDRHLCNAEYSSEILVVNDGSRDSTADIARKMSGAIRNLKVIDNEMNRGKGAAVRQGMLLARGQIRLFTDADNSTAMEHFDRMIPYFRAGADVVFASRGLKESRFEPPQSFFRRFLGRGGNLIIQGVVLRGIWDTQCGFKALSERAAERVFQVAKVNGWGFDVEILALAKRFGYVMQEIPVVWVNSERSNVRASAYLQTLFEMFKIRWWLRDFDRHYIPQDEEFLRRIGTLK